MGSAEPDSFRETEQLTAAISPVAGGPMDVRDDRLLYAIKQRPHFVDAADHSMGPAIFKRYLATKVWRELCLLLRYCALREIPIEVHTVPDSVLPALAAARGTEQPRPSDLVDRETNVLSRRR